MADARTRLGASRAIAHEEGASVNGPRCLQAIAHAFRVQSLTTCRVQSLTQTSNRSSRLPVVDSGNDRVERQACFQAILVQSMALLLSREYARHVGSLCHC